MRYLFGIDDTDNEYSPGTGFRTRDLASKIHENRLGNVISISRHQLYVHPEIPFTSHNSSACMDIETNDIELLKIFSVEYLTKESADGSDVGICIANYQEISDTVVNWGIRAKKEILIQKEANQIATKNGIYLQGFLGTKGGIIGALAAVGLRKTGIDGRLFWISGKELRDFNGIYKVSDILEQSSFDQIISTNEARVELNHFIFVNDWLRPVLKNNKICVIVEPNTNHSEYEWIIASKEYIKSISD
jgi:hypothetical protein